MFSSPLGARVFQALCKSHALAIYVRVCMSEGTLIYVRFADICVRDSLTMGT